MDNQVGSLFGAAEQSNTQTEHQNGLAKGWQDQNNCGTLNV